MLDTLHYTIDESGSADETLSNQANVVLIHGLFGSADNLSVIARHLKNDYRVIKLDLPDHGKSPWSTSFNFENYAKQIKHTLAELGVTKAHFVAHSLGGKVAMCLTRIMPQLFDKLIVLDIAPVAYEHRHQKVIEGLSAVKLGDITSRQDAQKTLAQYIEDKGTQAFLLKSLCEENGQLKWRFNLELLARDYNALRDWPLDDETSNQDAYDGPVLFMKGQYSDYILKEHQAAIMAQFPNASAKIVQAGHWLHAEKPQVVNSLITKYLRGDKN